jgi:hypothetical protein
MTFRDDLERSELNRLSKQRKDQLRQERIIQDEEGKRRAMLLKKQRHGT